MKLNIVTSLIVLALASAVLATPVPNAAMLPIELGIKSGMTGWSVSTTPKESVMKRLSKEEKAILIAVEFRVGFMFPPLGFAMLAIVSIIGIICEDPYRKRIFDEGKFNSALEKAKKLEKEGQAKYEDYYLLDGYDLWGGYLPGSDKYIDLDDCKLRCDRLRVHL